jgi:hypothetical protein
MPRLPTTANPMTNNRTIVVCFRTELRRPPYSSCRNDEQQSGGI